MNESSEKVFDKIIRNLRAFLKYLANIWGFLSTFSAFFPLINGFHPYIPLPTFHPEISILLSTLGCLFAIFYQFTFRKKIAQEDIPERGFAYAVGVTFIYLIVPILPDFPFQIWPQLQSPIPLFFMELIYQLWLLIEPALYILIFYLFTRLFTALAVKEWIANETGVK